MEPYLFCSLPPMMVKSAKNSNPALKMACVSVLLMQIHWDYRGTL